MKKYWHYISRTLFGVALFAVGSILASSLVMFIKKYPTIILWIVFGFPLVGFFLNLCYCLGKEILDTK